MTVKFIMKNKYTVLDCNLIINFHLDKSKTGGHVKVVNEKIKINLIL